MMASFFKMNTASSLGSGSVSLATSIANPRGDLKAITTEVVFLMLDLQFSPASMVCQQEPEVTKDTVQLSTENIQPPVVQIQAPIDEPVVASKPKPSIPYPSRSNKQKICEKDVILALNLLISLGNYIVRAQFRRMLFYICRNLTSMLKRLGLDAPLIDVYGEELTLRVDDKAITFKVGQTSRYSYYDVVSINRIDVIDVACEEYAQKVLGFSDSSMSGNPTPSLDPILSTSSPFLTPFEEGDFILEEIEACLTNDSISIGN
ncbi:hypothetical protein Tco_1337791 [Tanacetum coccineum]